MKVLASFSLFLAIACSLKHVNETGDARKHYGLSHSSKCTDYFKTFKCMSACKSIGFQIYRMDHRCKCSCHDIKTSTILPFFKWGTNGTTRKIHETVSPHLYHIVGTLSPKSTSTVKSTTIESDENEESDDEASNESEDLITDNATDKDDEKPDQSDEHKLSNETDVLNTDTPTDDDENEQNDNVEDQEPTGVTKKQDTIQKVSTSSETSSTIISTTGSTTEVSTLPGI